MIKDTPNKLSMPTIALHWLIGITIIFMMPVAIYMADNEVFWLYPIHKSVGLVLFAFIVSRIIWRIKNGWPKPVSVYQVWEQHLSKLVHWVLIIGTVVFPLSGMTMSGAGGYGIHLFGIELLAMNPDPNDAYAVIALNETAAGIGHTVHEITAWVMFVAIILHVAGALKHHIKDKDDTLNRMKGKEL